MEYYNINKKEYVSSIQLTKLGLDINDVSSLSILGIYKVQDSYPEYDPSFYTLEPSDLYIDEYLGKALQQYYPVQLDNGTIKNRKAQVIANKRWAHEMSGFTDSTGTYIRTDVDSRSRLLTAINACDHTSPILFKINGEFKELTCVELQAMQAAISLFVQKCFDWEDKELKRLETLDTFEELVAFTPSEFNF